MRNLHSCHACNCQHIHLIQNVCACTHMIYLIQNYTCPKQWQFAIIMKWTVNTEWKKKTITSHTQLFNYYVQSHMRWYTPGKNDWPAICVVTVILVGGRYWWSDGMALTLTLYVVNGDSSLIVWLWTVGSSIISRRGTFCVCVMPCESTNSFTASNEICKIRHKTWIITKRSVELQMIKWW
jgi:hypothetical protein